MTDEHWSELFNLTNALLEGELSEADSERLAVWLSIDEEAQTYYVKALQLHAALTLEFFEEDEIGPSRNVTPGSSNQVTLLLNQATSPAGNLATLAPRARSYEASGAISGPVAFCKRLTALSGNVIVASLAVMLAVVAVYGSERLISEVLSARRASLADQRGGMIVYRGEEDKGEFIRKANKESGTRRIGSSGFEGVALASVFLFPLPPIHELEQIETARLDWTFKRKDGDPQFSVDLYGLGYVEPDSLDRLRFWEGPHDLSSRADYGMAGPAERKVSLVKRDAMTPDTQCGRISVESRELLRFVRTLYDDGAQEGDLAVFRLNSDSPTSQIERETGYAVVHPPSISGLTSPDELPTLIVTARSQLPYRDPVVAEAVMAAHSISEHRSGGLVRSLKNIVEPGGNFDGTRRVGSSIRNDIGLVNVLVFALPPVEKLEGLVSARLQWTLLSKDNAPNFAVDLYGLGYVRGDSYHGPCFWEGFQDQAIPAEYGLLGGTERQVHLLARSVMRPSTPCGQVVVENMALVKFLQSLYVSGAQEGDLVVFRLNADCSTLEIARGTGYSVVHAPEMAGRTVQADLPALMMTFH